MKKLKKWQLFSIIGATIAVVAGAVLFMFLNGGNPSEAPRVTWKMYWSMSVTK